MSRKLFAPLIVVAAPLLAMLLGAALPAPTTPPERPSLAGQLLIAAPTMGDPRFYHTVVMLVLHDRNGAMGIVINRPLTERPLASLLEALGDKDTAAAGSVRIFAGGPVQPDLGFVLHSADYRRADTKAIDASLAMTSSVEILRDIAHGQAPSRAWSRLATPAGAPASSKASSTSAPGSRLRPMRSWCSRRIGTSSGTRR